MQTFEWDWKHFPCLSYNYNLVANRCDPTCNTCPFFPAFFFSFLSCGWMSVVAMGMSRTGGDIIWQHWGYQNQALNTSPLFSSLFYTVCHFSLPPSSYILLSWNGHLSYEQRNFLPGFPWLGVSGEPGFFTFAWAVSLLHLWPFWFY